MLKGTEQKAKRKWLLFIIFAPGVFFIIYWASIRDNVPMTHNVDIPQSYIELGERTELDGEWYRVFQGDKLFSDRVELPNNLAIAEPGRVFLGLGLALDGGMFQRQIKVIDSLGNLYAPLDVKKDVVARTFGFTGKTDELFMFKVNAKAENYYFIIKNGREQAWKVANTYNK